MPEVTASLSQADKQDSQDSQDLTEAPLSRVRAFSLHRPNHSLEELEGPQESVKASTSVLFNPHYNKGTAFTTEERKQLRIEGLLPCSVETMETQLHRTYKQLHRFTLPLSQNIYLSSLRERNETLFYRILMDNLEELLPIIYTPTVGQACLEYGLQFRQAEGMYISKKQEGNIRRVLDNWKANVKNEVSVIVVTDGSRILALGDLGASGMGISIGKLSLYVAAGGFHPATVLPVVIDAGTDNPTLLADEFYLGQRHPRLPDSEYYALIEEFMVAVKDKWPRALLQFEDISNNHCFDLLEKYRNRQLCFNDDIQGTGAVIAAGFLNALKITKVEARANRILMVGAGSAGIGVVQQISKVLEQEHGLTPEECRALFYMVDSKGLVRLNRGDKLAPFKIPYARTDIDHNITELVDMIKLIKPTALIGLSAQAGVFTREVIKLMGSINEKPIIFPLSNPTNNCECSFKDAFELTDGRVVFASGSPFDSITAASGKVFQPSQGNNLYAFPGLGYGAWLCRAEKVTDEMVTAASTALADAVTTEDLAAGRLYPCLKLARHISALVAARVIAVAVQQGIAHMDSVPNDLVSFVKANAYYPEYLSWPEKGTESMSENKKE